MAVWKLAPALAAGNCVVLKPAEQTPMSILVLAELIADLLPPGVLNIVNGFGVEAGKPLAQNKRIAKIAFTGETTTGRLIMQYASENIIPVTLELGGKSPNIFFADVMDAGRRLSRQGARRLRHVRASTRARSAPARAARSCRSRSMTSSWKARWRASARSSRAIRSIPTTMIGAQASNDQLEKILSYIDIGKQEGAKVLTGGERDHARRRA